MTNLFKDRREALGKTQREMSIILDLTEGTIRNWENGREVPHLKHVPKLAAVYQTTEAKIEQAILAGARAARELSASK